MSAVREKRPIFSILERNPARYLVAASPAARSAAVVLRVFLKVRCAHCLNEAYETGVLTEEKKEMFVPGSDVRELLLPL